MLSHLLLAQAAYNDLPQAIFELGRLYEEKAKKAEQNNGEQNNNDRSNTNYYNSKGLAITKSEYYYNKAASHLKKAVRLNYLPAIFALSMKYLNGFPGFKKDEDKAKKYRDRGISLQMNGILPKATAETSADVDASSDDENDG
jgi:TPR repeat protein